MRACQVWDLPLGGLIRLSSGLRLLRLLSAGAAGSELGKYLAYQAINIKHDQDLFSYGRTNIFMTNRKNRKPKIRSSR
jgi:hypothetical protein